MLLGEGLNVKKLQKVIMDTVPVMAGYLVLGAGFGIVMRSEGYTTMMALCMSLFIYAGSMQYAAIGLFGSGAGLLTAGLTAFAVNARHFFYGLSMIEPYKGAGIRKPYLIFALTDETYSLVCDGKKDTAYCFLVSLFDHIYWVAGTLFGALLGDFLRFNTEGIDFALTALFITVFTDQWIRNKDHFPALAGVFASVLALIVFGKDSFLIPAMILIFVCLSGKEAFHD